MRLEGRLSLAYVARMYLEDGISVELAIPERLPGNIFRWGYFARGIRCPSR